MIQLKYLSIYEEYFESLFVMGNASFLKVVYNDLLHYRVFVKEI